jgi:hypothetical protein
MSEERTTVRKDRSNKSESGVAHLAGAWREEEKTRDLWPLSSDDVLHRY